MPAECSWKFWSVLVFNRALSVPTETSQEERVTDRQVSRLSPFPPDERAVWWLPSKMQLHHENSLGLCTSEKHSKLTKVGRGKWIPTHQNGLLQWMATQKGKYIRFRSSHCRGTVQWLTPGPGRQVGHVRPFNVIRHLGQTTPDYKMDPWDNEIGIYCLWIIPNAS